MGQSNAWCGNILTAPIGRGGKQDCCGNVRTDCDDEVTPTGVAYSSVVSFAINEAIFLLNFVEGWTIATSNGFTDLVRINPDYVLPTSSQFMNTAATGDMNDGR